MDILFYCIMFLISSIPYPFILRLLHPWNRVGFCLYALWHFSFMRVGLKRRYGD